VLTYGQSLCGFRAANLATLVDLNGPLVEVYALPVFNQEPRPGTFQSCGIRNMTMPERSASSAASGANGCDSRIWTVAGSTTSTPVTASSSLVRWEPSWEPSRVRCRSRDFLTASASSGVSSLNLTPYCAGA
jgi:hypothetical protein